MIGDAFLPMLGQLGETPGDFRLGTVDPAYVTGSLLRPRIVFDGETTASTKRYPTLGEYRPVAGDRVVMGRAGTGWVVLGRVPTAPPAAALDTSSRSGLLSIPVALVSQGAAIGAAIVVPAAPVSYRVTATAVMQGGGTPSARQSSVDFTSIIGTASEQGPVQNVDIPANTYATLGNQITILQNANATAQLQLRLRGTGNLQIGGTITWRRDPI